MRLTKPISLSARSLSALFVAGLVLLLISCAGRDNQQDSLAQVYIPNNFRQLSTLSETEFSGAVVRNQRQDHIVEFYTQDDSREATIQFFANLTGSAAISELILEEASRQGIAPALAFALAYHESRYRIRAVNYNASSIDRGLFQLNDRTFPQLAVEDFFDPATNVRLGIGHLAFCLREGGNEVVALAIYNAGLTRIRNGGTPLTTLHYISRIMEYRSNVEALFEAQIVAKYSDDILLVKATAPARAIPSAAAY